MTSLLLSAHVRPATQTVRSSSPTQYCWQSKRMWLPTIRALARTGQRFPGLSLALLPFLPSKQDCPFPLVLSASCCDHGHKGQQPGTVLPSWGWSVAVVGQRGKGAAWKGSQGAGGPWGWSRPPL